MDKLFIILKSSLIKIDNNNLNIIHHPLKLRQKVFIMILKYQEKLS
jgi:hypothetical protein